MPANDGRRQDEQGKPAHGPTVEWWGSAGGLRCGSLKGTNHEGGWKWEIASHREVWLWLNAEGEGLIWGERDRFYMKPGMFAMTGGDDAGEWSCLRHPGRHRMEMVRLGSNWLRERLGGLGGDVHHGLAAWVASGSRVAFCGLMGIWENDLRSALGRASEGDGSSRLLAEARILDWAAHRLFRQRVDSEALKSLNSPVRQTLQLLRERLDQALDLTGLARQAGVSSHHLSRLVRAETGLTLQHHLRRLRIERACEYLDSGRSNVTEAALDCGYQSLSHFAKAFREETGKSPREWLNERKSK